MSAWRWQNAARTGLISPDGLTCVPPTAAAIAAHGIDLAQVAAFAPDAAQLRAAARRDVLAAVSATRLRYAPDAAHQSAAYDIKAQEADAFVAAGRPAGAEAVFPMLAASAAANGRTLSAHADAVRARRDAWRPILDATEALRERAFAAIAAAATAEAIEAARSDYVGQLAGL